MYREISILSLKPGMFVAKLNLPWFKHPFLFSQRGIINSFQQIEDLKQLGVTKVTIDTERGSFFDDNSLDFLKPDEDTHEETPTAPTIIRKETRKAILPQSQSAKVPVDKEMRFAAKLYTETVEYAKTVMSDIKSGKQINVKESHHLVDGLIESIFRNADAICTLTKLKAYDEYTYTHCINLAALSVIFGRHYNLQKDELRLIGLSGLFHDIGKASIPETVLNKPGKLTDAEFEVMKRHPLEGYRILKQQSELHPAIRTCALEHHERFDGKGYPRKVNGAKMARISSMVSVVDVYDALTSERVYKPRIMPHVALRIMYQCRDKDFSSVYVDSFIKCLGIYPVTSLVRLNNGDLAVVLESNEARPLFPKVKVILNKKLMPVHPKIIDLGVGDTLYLDGRKVEISGCVDPRMLKLDLDKYVY